ncbi:MULTISPECIES: trans-aconitate 2-methyltransferase [unclassified Rubrivivax]|uniref:class I SAM-dependent methyltransferase n=1 Tax=unclassified Rubrivivax TaxID=2649762 RepID=UPI0013E948FE|nr:MULTISPECIES: methyltransferase domain-containing protein [unclassified Rubrivivax]MCC9595539.1 class I SAM-dependent methyltransferase [Rubrivivax sp. JA1055]MCC9646954.1 class I SAM-dependent methyltransferase [Rubrivivax sp. JA1029]
MPETDAAERSTRRPLDEAALARVLRRLRAADAPPWLHGEVARRMADRLAVIRKQPAKVLDWWAATGASRGVLAAAYPAAEIVAVESEAAPAPAAAPWWSPRRWGGARPLQVLAEADVPPGGAELVWANMMLHGVADPRAAMARWHRALAVDGFLMFSTLGPGTLERLRSLYAAQGWPAPFAPFVDMHDLGDMLVEAGFADPVMDQEIVTLTWPDAAAAIAELRTLGGNVAVSRHAGLRTPRWRRRLEAALAADAAADGRPALAFEIVFGHAFRPPPRPRVAAQTAVPLDDLRSMVRAGRPGRG